MIDKVIHRSSISDDSQSLGSWILLALEEDSFIVLPNKPFLGQKSHFIHHRSSYILLMRSNHLFKAHTIFKLFTRRKYQKFRLPLITEKVQLLIQPILLLTLARQKPSTHLTQNIGKLNQGKSLLMRLYY